MVQLPPAPAAQQNNTETPGHCSPSCVSKLCTSTPSSHHPCVHQLMAKGKGQSLPARSWKQVHGSSLRTADARWPPLPLLQGKAQAVAAAAAVSTAASSSSRPQAPHDQAAVQGVGCMRSLKTAAVAGLQPVSSPLPLCSRSSTSIWAMSSSSNSS